MTVSNATAFLEKAYDALNKQYFENALTRPIITIQTSPKAHGHFTCSEVWHDNHCKRNFHEINLSAESLSRPLANTIATLLHEMVHQFCQQNNIQDTSRGHTYHNRRFKDEAEKRGLVIDYDEKIGWSITQPSKDLRSFIASQHWSNKLTIYRGGTFGGNDPKPKAPSSTRKYLCPVCRQSVRATKEVNIICADCGKMMLMQSSS